MDFLDTIKGAALYLSSSTAAQAREMSSARRDLLSGKRSEARNKAMQEVVAAAQLEEAISLSEAKKEEAALNARFGNCTASVGSSSGVHDQQAGPAMAPRSAKASSPSSSATGASMAHPVAAPSMAAPRDISDFSAGAVAESSRGVRRGGPSARAAPPAEYAEHAEHAEHAGHAGHAGHAQARDRSAVDRMGAFLSELPFSTSELPFSTTSLDSARPVAKSSSSSSWSGPAAAGVAGHEQMDDDPLARARRLAQTGIGGSPSRKPGAAPPPHGRGGGGSHQQQPGGGGGGGGLPLRASSLPQSLSHLEVAPPTPSSEHTARAGLGIFSAGFSAVDGEVDPGGDWLLHPVVDVRDACAGLAAADAGCGMYAQPSAAAAPSHGRVGGSSGSRDMGSGSRDMGSGPSQPMGARARDGAGGRAEGACSSHNTPSRPSGPRGASAAGGSAGMGSAGKAPDGSPAARGVGIEGSSSSSPYYAAEHRPPAENPTVARARSIAREIQAATHPQPPQSRPVQPPAGAPAHVQPPTPTPPQPPPALVPPRAAAVSSSADRTLDGWIDDLDSDVEELATNMSGGSFGAHGASPMG